jgi:hypothetical protein
MRGQYDEAVADARRAVKLRRARPMWRTLPASFSRGVHPLHLLAYHGNRYVLARNAEKG